MRETLLPCPFCGQPAKLESGRDPAKAGCFNPDCGVKPKASSTDSSNAVRKWNNRTPGNFQLATRPLENQDPELGTIPVGTKVMAPVYGEGTVVIPPSIHVRFKSGDHKVPLATLSLVEETPQLTTDH